MLNYIWAAMIAIGVFISSLTVSQVISAIATFAVSILILLMGQLASLASGTFVATVVEWLSFDTRYAYFTQGIFNISRVVLSVGVLPLVRAGGSYPRGTNPLGQAEMNSEPTHTTTRNTSPSTLKAPRTPTILFNAFPTGANSAELIP